MNHEEKDKSERNHVRKDVDDEERKSSVQAVLEPNHGKENKIERDNQADYTSWLDKTHKMATIIEQHSTKNSTLNNKNDEWMN